MGEEVSHIDEVIKLIKEVGKFDFTNDIYKYRLEFFFKEYSIDSKDEMIIFLELLIGSTHFFEYTPGSMSFKIKQRDTTCDVQENVQSGEQVNIIKVMPVPSCDDVTLSFFERQGVRFKKIKNIINSDMPSNASEDRNPYYYEVFQKLYEESNQNKTLRNKIVDYLYKNFDDNSIGSLEEKFWNNFLFSFLKAEYVIITRYSENLKKAIKNLEDFYEDQSKDSKDMKSFYLVKSFVRISWEIINLCDKIKIMIKEENKEIMIVNTDTKIRFFGNQVFNKIEFSIGETNSRTYEKLMKLVIKMAEIDNHYFVSYENVDNLFQLLGRISGCGLDSNIIQMIKIKSTVLLNGILKKIEAFTNIDPIALEEYESTNKLIKWEENPFLKSRASSFKNEIKYDDAFKYYEILKYSISEKFYNDVKTFDEYTLKGIKEYCDNSVYFFKQENNELNISDIKNHLRNKELNNEIISSQQLIFKYLDFLCNDVKKSIETLQKDIKKTIPKDISDISDMIDMLNKLEVMLARYITIHKTNKISPFRPTFQYSFYKLINIGSITSVKFQEIELGNNYTRNKIPDDTFFFSSADVSPIRMVWLEKTLYDFKTKIQRLSFKYDLLLNALSSMQIGKVEGMQGKIMNEVEKVNEKHIFKVERYLENSKRENITVLGILTAMVMFVTASTNFFQLKHATYKDYLIFAAILVGSLTLLVGLIKLIYNPTKLSNTSEAENITTTVKRKRHEIREEGKIRDGMGDNDHIDAPHLEPAP